MSQINVSKAVAEVFDSVKEDPTRLHKGVEVPEMVVESVDAVSPFGESINSDFLRGKHSMVITGKRNGEETSCSLIAEQTKSAMKVAGIRLKKDGKDKYSLPSCTFSANGYSQSWKLL